MMFGIVLDEQNSQDFMDTLKRCVRFKATYSATMRGRKEALEKMSGDVVNASRKVNASRRIIKKNESYIVVEGGKKIYSSSSKKKAIQVLSGKTSSQAKDKGVSKNIAKIGELATSLEKSAHKIYAGFKKKRLTPYFQSLSIGARKLFREQSGSIYTNGKKGTVENTEQGVVSALASLKKEISSVRNSRIAATMLSDIAFLERNINEREAQQDGWS